MPTGQANRLMPTLRRVVLARQSAARTDGELLGAFVLTCDADAFAELVRRHGPMVLGVCRRVVGDHTTADDAFQAAFLVLARRAASVRPREQVGNWLYGVAYRTALKARMVLARRRSREKQVDVMPEPTAPSPPPAWNDLQPVIDEELAKLPDKLRLPVVLCDLEGRPQREVARHLNVPPATLATRLASARRTLAARLTRRGVTLSGGALAGLLGAHASASAVPHSLAAGVVRAVESVAAGGALNSLVSAHAVQLSEGVMRMMMLAKLKAIAVLAVTALALTTGLGVGLMPAAAGDQPDPTATAKPAPATQPAPSSIDKQIAARLKDAKDDPEADDATFLRRLSLDVRGTVPTEVETWFFVSDADGEKRTKVVEWITDDEAVRLTLAKKLGVPPDRVKVIRARLSADGKRVVIAIDGKEAAATARVVETLPFTPDGKKLIVGNANVVKENKLFVVTDKDAATKIDRVILNAYIGDTGKQVDHLRLWNPTTGEKQVIEDDGFFRSWTTLLPDNTLGVWVGGDEKQPDRRFTTFDYLIVGDSDAEFLKRVLTDVRGNAPTALELKYFTEDKDPKKREKLIDTLLKDPAVQKKLGDEWKKKMLALKTSTLKTELEFFYYLVPEEKGQKWKYEVSPSKPLVVPLPPNPPTPPTPPAAPQADKLEKLVGELIAAQKTDEAILEAVTLATLSRLPTDSEKKHALAGISKTADRKAAWVAVARALAGTDTKPDVLKLRLHVEPPTPPKP